MFFTDMTTRVAVPGGIRSHCGLPSLLDSRRRGPPQGGEKGEGNYLQFDGEKHTVPFGAFMRPNVWVYGQQEEKKYLLAARNKRGVSVL